MMYPPPHGHLNDQQKEAIKQISAWFFGTKEKYFTLSGTGGTGKNYLLPDLFHHLQKKFDFFARNADAFSNDDTDSSLSMNYNESLLLKVTATQNDAKASLIDMGFSDAVTIYRALSLRVKVDYKTGATSIVPINEVPIDNFTEHNTLIVVDEASFISLDLMRHLEKSPARFLFIGDPTQLRAVGSEQFSVFGRSITCKGFELTEIQRSESPALRHYVTELKAGVSNMTLASITNNDDNVFVLDDEDFLQKLYEVSSTHHRADEFKVLTYTNQAAHSYNMLIREHLNRPLLPVPGDVIIVNDRYSQANSTFTDTNRGFGLAPAQRIFVIENNRGNCFLSSESKNQQNLTNLLDQSYPILKGATKFIQAVPMSEYNFSSRNLVQRYYYYNIPIFYSDDARRSSLQSLKQDAIQNNRWHPYYAVKSSVLDYRFSYAETIHKSQGRTYPHVFIDLPNVLACRDNEVLLRLLYVAFSRASIAVYIRNVT